MWDSPPVKHHTSYIFAAVQAVGECFAEIQTRVLDVHMSRKNNPAYCYKKNYAYVPIITISVSIIVLRMVRASEIV